MHFVTGYPTLGAASEKLLVPKPAQGAHLSVTRSAAPNSSGFGTSRRVATLANPPRRTRQKRKRAKKKKKKVLDWLVHFELGTPARKKAPRLQPFFLIRQLGAERAPHSGLLGRRPSRLHSSPRSCAAQIRLAGCQPSDGLVGPATVRRRFCCRCCCWCCCCCVARPRPLCTGARASVPMRVALPSGSA